MLGIACVLCWSDLCCTVSWRCRLLSITFVGGYVVCECVRAPCKTSNITRALCCRCGSTTIAMPTAEVRRAVAIMCVLLASYFGDRGDQRTCSYDERWACPLVAGWGHAPFITFFLRFQHVLPLFYHCCAPVLIEQASTSRSARYWNRCPIGGSTRAPFASRT